MLGSLTPVLAVILAAGTVVGISDAPRPEVVVSDGGAGTAFAGSGSSEPGAPDAKGTSTRRFIISGSVSGLYPGATLPLTLTVTNPEPFSITVSSISATVIASSNSCVIGELTVSKFSGQLHVPAKQIAHTAVVAELAQTAPDACQGTTFSLGYSGTASIP